MKTVTVVLPDGSSVKLQSIGLVSVGQFVLINTPDTPKGLGGELFVVTVVNHDIVYVRKPSREEIKSLKGKMLGDAYGNPVDLPPQYQDSPFKDMLKTLYGKVDKATPDVDPYEDDLDERPEELHCTFCGGAGGEVEATRGDVEGEYLLKYPGQVTGAPQFKPIRHRRVFWMGLCRDCSLAHSEGKMLRLAEMMDHAQKVVDGKV